MLSRLGIFKISIILLNLAYFFRSEVPTGNWFSLPYFNEPMTITDTDTAAPSTHTSTRSMSESEVKSTVTHSMTLQKRMSDTELPSTTTAIAVRKEVK